MTKRGLFILFILVFHFVLWGQEIERPESNLEVPEGILPVDSSNLVTDPLLPDSIATVADADTASVIADTTKAPKGDINTTINYAAKDSTKLDIANQKIYLYGDAHIDYGPIELDASRIIIDWATSTLTAKPSYDSAGNMLGRPVFKDGTESYETDEIRYNFRTRRAFIKGVVTKQGDGFVLGEEVKKQEDNTFYIEGGKFCPCNDPEALTYFKSSQIKMIPNDKVITGPFNLFIGDVPTPIGFAFGMFPLPKKQSSGIIFPSYGEENRRGFFLRNGGYYFDINDYINLAILGEVYSRGSHGFQINSTYKKRYQYSGRLNFRYNSQLVGDGLGDADSIRSRDYWVNWSFNPESRGPSRFSASVSAGTSGFNQNNLTSYQQQINAQFQSNVSYSTSFDWGSLTARANQNQNVISREFTMTLPEVGINVNRINPFQKKGSSAKTWYEKFNFSYSMNASNQITNVIRGLRNAEGRDSVVSFNQQTLPTILDQAKNGIRHSIPASTSLKIFRYFTLSPNFNYQENWYTKALDPYYDRETGRVAYDTVNQNKLNRVYQYSMGAGINTVFYGTFYFQKGRIKAIRHVSTPSLSFSYRPDFSQEKFGFYEQVFDTANNLVSTAYRYQGFLYGAPGTGRNGSVGLSWSNNFEMKTNSPNDTIDEDKKVTLLDALNFNTSYNMIADSFNLSNINFQARTSLFNRKLTVSMGGTIDPYTYQLDSLVRISTEQQRVVQSRISEYAILNGGGLGQLQSARIALSTNLNPRGREVDEEIRRKIEQAPPEDQQFLERDPSAYVDWEVPWNLRLSYSLNYNKRGFEEARITQTMSFSGDLKLSTKWNMGFSSGFDFEARQFTQTNLNITRDLNCWELRFDWTPFGRFTSYNFNLQIKAATLKDLKLSRRRSFFDF